MMETHYLVDTNVLARTSAEQRASEFFAARCRVPGEVVHEVRHRISRTGLEHVEYRVTAGVLQKLQLVMQSVMPGDTTLVDLYANKGNADPLLVACALDATDAEALTLFRPTWVVVTDDDAVARKAAQFGIESCSGEMFLSRLEAA